MATAMVLGRGMGDAILEMLEKEEGLEIASEDPANVDKEIDRIFVDEFGFAKEISAEVASNGDATISVSNCINTKFTDKMLANGVKMNFTCPIMLAVDAYMRRIGRKGRVQISRWPEGKGCKISFKA